MVTNLTSCCFRDNYWASGGQRGELTLKDLRTNYQITITTTLAQTINNGVSFSRIGGNLRMLVSSNDASVRVYSVPELQLVQTLDFNTAVNHTSISPDGTKMTVVGDDNKVHLFGISSNGEFHPITTMAAAKDANFSVAWNHSSEKFAVASQDGSVHVWDVRHRDPLFRFGAMGLGHSALRGAARCVKFTQSGAIDLLAFTEHVSHINVIDARTFDGTQVIRVGNSGIDTPITGLGFSSGSHSMFVGLENVILEYPVDTSARRRFPKGVLL
ncbi:WD40-repeat-containing domain protein [Spinellus fusiger]|nr:WD40-repeat-containing domain protein [Spinellus fusiger]